jgi:hypothetical protein
MLPKNLKYGTKVESAIARSSRVNIAPQNGTGPYLKGDTIIINLPTRNNLVMVPTESYLKFNIVFSSGNDNNALRWDSCGAHGLIQRLRIFHGSNLIQDIDQYGLLAKMLFDVQQPTDAVYGKQNILAGTRSDLVATTAAGDAAAQASKNIPAFQVNSGERILAADGTNALIANAGLTKSETYCINLISLVGSLCTANYIPLFAMTSAPLRVELQLVDNVNKCCACLTGADANAFAISNCEYVANMIELGDPAMQIIYSSLQGEPLQFVVPDFRNYQYSLSLTNNVQTQVTFPIPAKFSSLKALFVCVRDKGTGLATFFPFSSVTMGINDYQFRVGATIMPPRAPNTLPEMFSEVVKAIGSIGDINYQPSIDKRAYTQGVSVANAEVATAGQVSAVSSGSFYIGLDLENYCSAPKDTIFAGYNSNTDDIFLIANFTQQTGGNVITRFDAFANFDSVVVCDNNTAYVRF